MGAVNKGKSVVALVVGALVVVAAGAGIMHIIRGMSYMSTDDAYVQGHIHQIASRVSGTVQKVYVTDNQSVRKGDALVELDPADYAVRLSEAEAVLTAEEARLAEAAAKVSAAEAAVDIQQTTLKQAVIDAGRAGRLFADGALPREKLEKAQTALELAKGQVKAATEALSQNRATRELEKALIEQRKAARDNVKLQLGYTQVTAPADGLITKKSAEVGNQVQAGQPLMALVALNELWVEANFKETQLTQLRPGQAATVRVDTYPGHVFTGKVESVMAGTGAAFSLFPPENAMGNYVKVVQRVPVKIMLDADPDTSRALRVGMSVVAEVKVK